MTHLSLFASLLSCVLRPALPLCEIKQTLMCNIPNTKCRSLSVLELSFSILYENTFMPIAKIFNSIVMLSKGDAHSTTKNNEPFALPLSLSSTYSMSLLLVFSVPRLVMSTIVETNKKKESNRNPVPYCQ